MSLSSRIRITLNDHRAQQLAELADHANRSRNDEARVLLEWAVAVMSRRLGRIYGYNRNTPGHEGPDPQWLQLALPEQEAFDLALTAEVKAIRRRVLAEDSSGVEANPSTP